MVQADMEAPNSSLPSPSTLLSAYQLGLAILQAAEVDNADNEAFWLLEAGLGISRLRVHAEPNARVSPADWARTESLFRRRASREPLQYIVGTQVFRGRDFLVNSSVLIPRPETELIIEEVLASRFSTVGCHMVDMGTGSGCLAVSLALDCPGATVSATDCSAPALQVAGENAQRHGVADRIRFFRGECLKPLAAGAFAGKVSIIVSNPPYIPSEQCGRLPREVRAFEPLPALNGGSDGLAFYDRLLAESPLLLHPGGILVMEMGVHQSEDVRRKVGEAFIVKTIRRDQAGIDRVICLERTSSTWTV
ncbi:MAG: peptide chain release factor N(5)-glutamine methyltransferase [Nitrospira sp.]|nr:peptide chain release factor N(5)-glutamine methyltransferase [Nitrospira sp.]MDE0486418.1 peptide chain release factor N(5)-glutamine methyltransferase [Nitrospira sp.]